MSAFLNRLSWLSPLSSGENRSSLPQISNVGTEMSLTGILPCAGSVPALRGGGAAILGVALLAVGLGYRSTLRSSSRFARS